MEIAMHIRSTFGDNGKLKDSYLSHARLQVYILYFVCLPFMPPSRPIFCPCMTVSLLGCRFDSTLQGLILVAGIG
jgi:hypothetical protein